jgi:hypothetical protein
VAKSKVMSAVLGAGLPAPRLELLRPLRGGESAVFAYSSLNARKLASLCVHSPANFSGSRQLLVDPNSATATVVLVAHCIAPFPAEASSGRKTRKGSLRDRIAELEAALAQLLPKESTCTSSTSN